MVWQRQPLSHQIVVRSRNLNLVMFPPSRAVTVLANWGGRASALICAHVWQDRVQLSKQVVQRPTIRRRVHSEQEGVEAILASEVLRLARHDADTVRISNAAGTGSFRQHQQSMYTLGERAELSRSAQSGAKLLMFICLPDQRQHLRRQPQVMFSCLRKESDYAQ